MSDPNGTGPHVVVLGGGLAGVACAHRLGDEGVRVTLVDRNDYHQFQPLLYQVATSQLPAEDIARPHRTIFRDYPTVEVCTDEVVALDPAAHSVTLAGGRQLSGSHLVIAAGAQPQFFGVPGAAEHAFPLYAVADAERLRLQLQGLLTEAADAPPEADGVQVVVVGGGPTGVETAGALAELMAALAATERIRRPGRISLVDRGGAVLGAFSERSHSYAHDKLTSHGVDLRLHSGVASVHADHVELADHSTIDTKVVIWAGGESAAPIVASSGLRTGRGGRIDVEPDLTVDGHPGVYAVGDAANVPDNAVAPEKDGGTRPSTLPQLGSVAQQSGRWAAENILRELRGSSREPFRYKDKGIMAMIGRNAAVAEVGKHRHQVEGPMAFAAWLGVHAMLLSGAHSKADAFLSWAWDYFDRDHPAIVEASATPARIAWADDTEDVPNIVVDRRTPTAAGQVRGGEHG
jgi:NADH dehydrogenase